MLLRRKRLKETVLTARSQTCSALDVGAQRLIRESRFPDPRCKRNGIAGRVAVNALEHVHQLVGIGIDAVQPARGQQTLDYAHLTGTRFAPTE